MIEKVRDNAVVMFNKSRVPKKVFDEYYKDTFENKGVLKEFVFLGEIPNRPGHCLLYDFEVGVIIGMYHIEDFVEVDQIMISV